MDNLIFKMDDEGKLTIDAFHLLHELPENRHIELAESLSCSNMIITHVMDQVLQGCTENGFSGPWTTSYNEPLQKYRMQIAKQSTEVAKSQIEELQRRLEMEKEQTKKYSDMYFKLYHKDSRSDFCG